MLINEIKDERCYIRLSSCYLSNKNYLEGCQNLEKAVEIMESNTPKNTEYFDMYIIILTRLYFKELKKFDLSYKYATKMLEKYPQNPEALMIAGYSLFNQGLYE